jgi:hypothetical protein
METFPITQFQGLDQTLLLPPAGDPRYTRDLDGVEVRRGRVFGAGGTSKFLSISTVSATTPILKLMLYTGTSYTSTVVRMTPTKVFSAASGASSWTDVTGTDLTGTSTTRPQWTMHKGVLVFTNEQTDLPRKWTGSGNTAELGGTPPKAVGICDYMGYLFLWNVIVNSVTFPRQGLYSDDYDNDWSACTGHELNLHETPGEVRAALAQGAYQMVYKADGIVAVRFVGGKVRFQQELLPYDVGILAPASLKLIGGAGHIFLGTDLQLHTNFNGQVKALPPRVIDKLQSTMDVTYADFASAAVMNDTDTYYLFYRTSSSDSFKRARIAYNYRTGEFAHRTYAGHEFLDALGFKFSPDAAEKLIASANDLVYELNDTSSNPSDDDGTAIDRHYTTDWQDFGWPFPKILHRVEMVFKRAPHTRIKVSIATDDNETFRFERSFDLKGRNGDSTVTLIYDLPQPMEATRFNLKVRFFHDSTNVAEMRTLHFKWDKTYTDSDVGTKHQSQQVL